MILLNENIKTLFQISPTIVPMVVSNNKLVYIQVKAWHRAGNIVWANEGFFTDVYMRHSASDS